MKQIKIDTTKLISVFSLILVILLAGCSAKSLEQKPISDVICPTVSLVSPIYGPVIMCYNQSAQFCETDECLCTIYGVTEDGVNGILCQCQYCKEN